MTTQAPTRWLKRAKAIAGLDIHVALTLLLRGWGILAGALSILLIPHFFSPAEQGYYYTFASILALQIFFELGIGQVVIQIVAHEAVHLQRAASGPYEGQPESLARLFMLRKLLHRWYLPAALLFAIVVSSAGLAFFHDGGLPWTHWAPAWALLVATSAVNLFFSGKLAMVEGFALVRDVAQLRLLQSITGYLLMWIGLASGAGLWVVAAVPATAALTTGYWLRIGPAAAVLGIRSSQPPAQPIRWTQDILPIQWRIALSWISGYFVLHLFTPLVFRQSGAAEAGRLGLAMTVFSAISVIGMSWINAKVPNFSMLIARRESRQLLELFKGVAWRSLAITALLAAAVTGTAAWGVAHGLPMMQRVASPAVLVCLAWVTVVNCAIFAAALFMRAHREEPMVPVSIAGSMATCLITWLASRHGVLPMMIGYALVTTFITLPWTLWILRRYLSRHRDGTQAPPSPAPGA